MCSRTSWATKFMKLTTYCGSPSKRLRSSGSCVAMPTGQVLRWQTRIITQPSVTSGAVAKPNSSAPSSAATTTSRPVFIWPSTSSATRERRSLMSSVWLRLGEAELPGQARVLDRAERRGARAAVVAADQDHVGVGLGHARGDRADAHLGDELHGDPRARVGVLEVVDQLREVLDGVDVVVRWRRDEAHARRRVADLGDPGVDLVAGQLAALAGLGALGHLDLDLARAHEVLAGDAEAARGDLLDRALERVAVGSSVSKRAGSSPPSPVFDLPPRRFIAIASASWASLEMEP